SALFPYTTLFRSWGLFVRSVRPAALLVFLPAAAGARVVAARAVVAAQRGARGERLDPVAVEVGQHAGDAHDDFQPLAVGHRRGRGGGVGRVDDLAAGEAVEQVERLADPVVPVQPAVPGLLAQGHALEEAQGPVVADVEF